MLALSLSPEFNTLLSITALFISIVSLAVNLLRKRRAQTPKPQSQATSGDGATPKQLGMIRAICRELKLDPNETAMSVIRTNLQAASKRQASTLIGHLKDLQQAGAQ